MKELNRNQLAENIVLDGQPVRAISNYLLETIEALEGFDCITDYYSKNHGDLLQVENHPVNRPNLKMNKKLFMEYLEASIQVVKEG